MDSPLRLIRNASTYAGIGRDRPVHLIPGWRIYGNINVEGGYAINTDRNIRIAICDDQQLIADGLQLVLRRYPGIVVVGVGYNGSDALRLAKDDVDVFLMDLRMPELDGLAATRAIAQQYPNTQIIALTTFSDRTLIADCLEAGAHGYVLKDVQTDNLVQIIRLVHSGHMVWPPSLVNAVTAGSSARLPAVPVTEREQEVLRCLARGLSNKEIADALKITESTVKNHLSNLYGKFDVRDRVQALMYAQVSGVLNFDAIDYGVSSRFSSE